MAFGTYGGELIMHPNRNTRLFASADAEQLLQNISEGLTAIAAADCIHGEINSNVKFHGLRKQFCKPKQPNYQRLRLRFGSASDRAMLQQMQIPKSRDVPPVLKTINPMPIKLIPRLIAFPIIACVGQCYWMMNVSPTNAAASLIWIPLLAYAWFCIGGFSHEVVHGNLNLNLRLAKYVARSIGTLLGIPYTVYKEVHMRHHAYLNTPLDWEMWPYGDPKASLGFRRIFVWFDVLFAVVATPIIWGRICFSKESPVSHQIRRTMKWELSLIHI